MHSAVWVSGSSLALYRFEVDPVLYHGILWALSKAVRGCHVNYWLLKTEPSTYSWANLVHDSETVWDGVRNAQARIHLRTMHAGDQAFIYHSGDERQIVGLAEITSEPYADPTGNDEKAVVVRVRAVRPVAQSVQLATVKRDPLFAQLGLVRMPRLSVMPVAPEQWQQLLVLAGLVP